MYPTIDLVFTKEEMEKLSGQKLNDFFLEPKHDSSGKLIGLTVKLYPTLPLMYMDIVREVNPSGVSFNQENENLEEIFNGERKYPSEHTIKFGPPTNEEPTSEVEPTSLSKDTFRENLLLNALNDLLSGDLGCPMCDNGKLRNPDKEHWDNCKWENARKIFDHFKNNDNQA